jgi:hypothetical protein
MGALFAIFIVTLGTLAGLRLVAPPRLRKLIGPCEFAAAVALPLLASFGRFYIVFALGVGLLIFYLPAVFGNARGGVALLEHRLRLGCFALPLLPMLYWDVAVSSFTIVQLNYVTVLAGALAAALLTSGVRLPQARLASWDATFAAMLAAQLFMDVRGDDLLFTLRSMLQLALALGLPYFVFSRAVAMSEKPSELLLVLLIATAAVAAVALFEALRSWLLYDGMPASIGADLESRSGYGKLRGGLLRPRATWPESTGLSLFFAVGLAALYALRRQIGSKRLVSALAIILTAGLFITFARVGYMAVVVGLTACLVYERRYGRLALLVLAIPVAALGLRALAEIVPMIGVSIGLADDAADTLNYREMLLRDGLALWREHWLIGLSLPELYARLEHLRQGEGIIDLVNQPLAILMRGGVVFAAIYFAMMIRVLATLFGRRRRLDGDARAVAGAAFAGLLTLLAGLFTTSYGRNDTTFIILLAIGAGTLARRSRTATIRAPEPEPQPLATAAIG